MIKSFSLRNFIYLFCFLGLLACKGKTDNCTQWDYNRCKTEKPSDGTILIKLTVNSQYPNVEVKLFDGDFEKNILLLTSNATHKQQLYTMPHSQNYSATATYIKGQDTLVVVNGGRLKVESYQMCELTCYEAGELILDLRLK